MSPSARNIPAEVRSQSREMIKRTLREVIGTLWLAAQKVGMTAWDFRGILREVQIEAEEELKKYDDQGRV